MKIRVQSKRGIVLPLVIAMMVIFVPIGLVMMKISRQNQKASIHDRQERISKEVANNIHMDFMKQFAEAPYEDHFDPAKLARPQAYMNGGYTDVQVTPDRNNKTILIEAKGTVEQGSDKVQRRITALIKFESKYTLFGTAILDGEDYDTDAALYRGGVWVPGTLKVSNLSDVTFEGGPVIIGKDLDNKGHDVLVEGGPLSGGRNIGGGDCNRHREFLSFRSRH